MIPAKIWQVLDHYVNSVCFEQKKNKQYNENFYCINNVKKDISQQVVHSSARDTWNYIITH